MTPWTNEGESLSYQQQVLSRSKRARNQCHDCGVFRLDGLPPTVHRHGCNGGPDGSQLDLTPASLAPAPEPQRRPAIAPISEPKGRRRNRH